MSDHSGTCRDCGQSVYWTRTAKSGKAIPLNDDYGSHTDKVFDDEGNFHPRGGMGRTSHFDTCPSRNATKPESPDRARQWETASAGMVQTWNLGELRQMARDLGRLVGIMESSGADAGSVRRTREVFSACIKKEFGQ